LSRQLKAVIFDFNGVLVDDEPLHLELIQQVLREEGVVVNEELCRSLCLGVPDREGFQAVLAASGRHTSEEYVNQLLTRKAAAYLAAIQQRDLLFPGVSEVVKRLAVRWPLALVSGALRQEIEFILTRNSLREHFRAIVAAEDVTRGKPDPEGFLLGLGCLAETAALQPHECLVFEDSVAGVEAAKRAGMFCVAVTNSYPATALQRADVIVPNLLDLDPLAVFA
jgi:beta-phosphoglucomutase